MTKESKGKTSKEARSSAQEAEETTRRNFAEAARAGEKTSAEAFQWWFQMMSGTGWQKQMEHFNEAAGNMVPLVRRNCDEMFELWRATTISGAELLKQSIEMPRAPIGNDHQNNWVEMWSVTVKTAQSNIEAAAQFGTRAANSWSEFLRRNLEATTQTTW